MVMVPLNTDHPLCESSVLVKMSRQKWLTIIGLSLVALVSVSSADQNIRATAILFRHGERTPATTYPNLPCALCDELGAGQLTNVI